MERLDLGTVIVNWNGLADTLACLASIYEQAAVPAYVVVVDNGSADGSIDGIHAWLAAHPRFRAIEKRDNDVGMDGSREFALHDRASVSERGQASELALQLVTIENGKNLGFAAGCNVGLRFLLQRAVKYVVLLNNDTLLGPAALAILVAAMDEAPDSQCMVPQIRYSSAPERIWNCGAEWTWFGTPRYYYAEENVAALDGKSPFDVELVTGCALIIRAQWLETHGLLTERFFFGEEDVDLSWRMRSAGKGSMRCWPAAVVYHKVGASLTRRTEIAMLPKVYCHYLNRMIFLRTVWGRGYRWQARRLVVLAYLGWNLIFKFGFAPASAIGIVNDLARDSSERSGVDAEFFSWLMHEKFTPAKGA